MTRPQFPVARHALDGPARLRIFVPIGLAVTVLGIIWALADGSGVGATPATPAPAALPRPAIVAELPAVQLSSVPVADRCGG